MQSLDGTKAPRRRRTFTVSLAVITVFSALIALGTILSVPLPPPLYELDWSPAVFLALAVLVDAPTAFGATALGSFIGEAFNVAYRGAGSPIYPFGMIWARGPEVFIIAWAKGKGTKTLALTMVGATVFETLAFFFSDWAFYFYGLFQYTSYPSLWASFAPASLDFFTMLDAAYIPVAFVLIRAARPAFERLGYR